MLLLHFNSDTATLFTPSHIKSFPLLTPSFSRLFRVVTFFFLRFMTHWVIATRNDSTDSRNSVVLDPMSSVVEEPDADTVYVAVGKNGEKSQQLLHWTVNNFKGKNICLLHIHQPHSLNSYCEFFFNYDFFFLKKYYFY